MKPIQLIIDGVQLPTSTRDRYQAYEEDLTVEVNMISGRAVDEVRGQVWRINYAYDYMGDEKLQEVLTVLRRRGSKTVTFQPDNGGALITGTFKLTSLTPPTLAFYKDGTPKWHNLAFSLREVKPHA